MFNGAAERPLSSSIKFLNPANIWSLDLYRLVGIWKRLRKVSHPTASAMKHSRDSLNAT